MSTHTATVEWVRGDSSFRDSQYRREHLWQFDGGITVVASASPMRVPTPLSTEAAVDPQGWWSMTQVVLRPKVTGAVTPERQVLEKLHDRAHEACFLARSVKCAIRVEL